MSPQAKDIDEAHRLLKAVLGTPHQEAAQRYLDAVVDRVKREQRGGQR